MERVLIVGCSGNGKSVFARELGERTGLPVIHLDRVYWQTGWKEPESGEWRAAVKDLIAEPRWIMDGNYGSTLAMRLQRADTVFFFDLPRWLALTRVLRRTWRHYGRTRADLADGCPERLDWTFLKFVWNFNRNHRPRTIAALSNFDGDLVVFQRPAEVTAYFSHQALRRGAATG